MDQGTNEYREKGVVGIRVWYIIKNLRQKAVRLKWDGELGLEKNLNSSLSYELV